MDNFFKKGIITKAFFIIVFALLTVIFYREIILGKAFLWEDAVELIYPQRNYYATSLLSGRLPHWTDGLFSGMPFQSEPQTAVLYPPNLILLLFTGQRLSFYALEILTVLHIFLAGIFMYILMRHWRHGYQASFLAGIIYAFSSFATLHINHINLINSLAWFPLVVYFFDIALKKPSIKYGAWTAVIMALSALAGAPQLTVYFSLMLGAYFIFCLFSAKQKKRQIIVVGIVTALLFIGLWSCQLLPSLMLSQNAHRSVLTLSEAAESSVRLDHLLARLIIPDYYGRIGGSGEHSYVLGPNWQYWETSIYISILPILLFPLLFFQRRRRLIIFWLITAFVSLWLCLGTYGYLFQAFYYLMPLIRTFRIPPRFSILFVFAFSILAGASLGAYEEKELVRKNKGKLFAKRWFFPIVLCGICLIWALVFTPHQVKIDMTRFIIILLLSTFIIYFTRRNYRLFGYLIPIIVFFDFFTFSHDFSAGRLDPRLYYSEKRIPFSIQNDTSVYRMNIRKTRYILLPRNIGLVIDQEIIDGYDVLGLKRYAEFYRQVNDEAKFHLLDVKYYTAVDAENNLLEMRRFENRPGRVFFVHQILAVDSSQIVPLLNSSSFDFRSTALIEEPLSVPNREKFSISGEITYKKHLPEAISIKVENEEYSYIIISEVWYPSWRLYLDGKPHKLYRTNYALMGTVVPPGEHQLKLCFEPVPFRTGLIISIITSIIILCIILPVNIRDLFSKLRKNTHTI